MSKNIMKSICLALAALLFLLTLAACKPSASPDETTEMTTAEDPTVELPTEEETDPPVDEPPAISLDQLSFTPDSPEGQVLTEKGHSPQIIIRNYNETATDALGLNCLPLPRRDFLKKESM